MRMMNINRSSSLIKMVTTKEKCFLDSSLSIESKSYSSLSKRNKIIYKRFSAQKSIIVYSTDQ